MSCSSCLITMLDQFCNRWRLWIYRTDNPSECLALVSHSYTTDKVFSVKNEFLAEEMLKKLACLKC